MTTKFPLQHLYEQSVPRDQLYQLSNLFKQVLGITAATWSDVTTELAARRDEGFKEFTPIFGLYKYLDDMRSFTTAEDMR